MVRTVKTRHEEEDEDDEEFISRTTDGSPKRDGKAADQKANTLRSKHSETEQRRRSKINERFQKLRDLIPQNDQKRDKASFLLEVIQYIQFLQERLNIYEGSYQGWSQENSKLMPWRNKCGPVENYLEQSQLAKDGSGNEDNTVFTPAMLANAQYLVESDLNAASAYKTTDLPSVAATQSIPVNVQLQQNVYGDVSAQHYQGPASDTENPASQSQSQFWQGRPCTTESSVPSYTLNEQEEQKIESGEACCSNSYTQGLLNTLTNVLQSSGVDLSQTSISVQLDIGKRANSVPSATMFSAKDYETPSPGDQAMMAHYGIGSSCEDADRAHKKLRTEKS